MIRLHNTLRAQTFAIRHNDAHCHSVDDSKNSALISLGNVFLMHSPFSPSKKKKKKVPDFLPEQPGSCLEEYSHLCLTTKRVQLRFESKVSNCFLMNFSKQPVDQSGFIFTVSHCFNYIKSYEGEKKKTPRSCDDCISWHWVSSSLTFFTLIAFVSFPEDLRGNLLVCQFSLKST